MPPRRDPHDDASIAAVKKRRQKRRREEQREEWNRFENLTESLLQVPKTDLDDQREKKS
jgi:hypothetical protein